MMMRMIAFAHYELIRISLHGQSSRDRAIAGGPIQSRILSAHLSSNAFLKKDPELLRFRCADHLWIGATSSDIHKAATG